ncbi:flagellin N-terminal helical domain-containing protein [Dyella mobilis]|uniref:Flagellin n=1 Tax=Dyella mobilis TaxID=1849582 RepID=A0ABS2KA93_9GAMM|nr:flagellin [Dyella mobilis]MBM7128107.1 flagellin/flagellar hook associated protein [Dyella mobilis]GLQ99923.1 flagellin [Dyella mobilis]
MSLVLNTNISSLQAQNNLTASSSSLSTATEDLSSGLKINSAADNAAGYAISQRFQTQIGGLSQASQNASDAINLAQTAGSGLSQITSNLQSIRDLAVQAANGTYQASDRSAINTSVQQYLSEITRIANQTTFNGTNVLNGSTSSLSFQIGANVGQAINVQLGQGVTSSQMGQVSEVSTGDISGAFLNASGASGASMSLSGLSITGADGTSFTFSGSVTASSAQDVADAINAAGIDGVSAAVNASGGINIYSTGELAVNGSAVTGASAASAASGGFANLTSGAIAFGASGVGSAASGLAATGSAYTAGNVIQASGSLNGGDVLTVDDANQLISRVDAALASVSTFSSTLGAVQNRFQSAISTLSAQQTNLTSSQSSIQDTDFAAETAKLSQSQVLQQAGISVLATANSEPQNILKLLQ